MKSAKALLCSVKHHTLKTDVRASSTLTLSVDGDVSFTPRRRYRLDMKHVICLSFHISSVAYSKSRNLFLDILSHDYCCHRVIITVVAVVIFTIVIIISPALKCVDFRMKILGRWFEHALEQHLRASTISLAIIALAIRSISQLSSS
jgi:hypothetical protein